MAFESVAHVKEYAERLKSRMHNMAQAAERGIGFAMEIAEVNAATMGWGYVSGRWGAVPANAQPNTLPEYDVMGIPADLLAGGALLAISFFGGLGKYESHGIHLGAGSVGAFTYRLGYQLGATAGGHSTSVSGVPRQVGQGAVRVNAWGGRVRQAA